MKKAWIVPVDLSDPNFADKIDMSKAIEVDLDKQVIDESNGFSCTIKAPTENIFDKLFKTHPNE